MEKDQKQKKIFFSKVVIKTQKARSINDIWIILQPWETLDDFAY